MAEAGRTTTLTPRARSSAAGIVATLATFDLVMLRSVP
jgi:hypothetical protein